MNPSSPAHDSDPAMEMTCRLAAYLAHELNNLITPITVCGQMLKEDQGDPSSVAFCAEQVADAGARIQELAKKFQWIGSRRVSAEIINLAEIVPVIVDRIKAALPQNVGLSTSNKRSGNDGGTFVRLDEEQVDFLLRELVRNAVEAMPRGGNVTVDLCPSPVPGHIDLIIKDDGEGMTDQTRARMYEPFFSTRTKVRDRGLGLTVVYGIVRRAGGTIACESAPQSGTRFTLEFPLQPV